MSHNATTRRRQARELATQVIYQLTNPLNQSTMQEALDFALESGHFPDEGYADTSNDYVVPLINGVMDHLDEIDPIIDRHLTNWTLDRIAKIDLAILRIAVYEILFQDDQAVPDKVAIDEAIEMTKFFSNDTSRKFVNGVLNQILQQKSR